MATNPAPLVSVIVPVYNMEQYVAECLDSIIHQTYHNIEIIVVNDGSSDSSLAIVSEIAKQDQRITVIDKRNGGVSSARNAGISALNGKYVTFIDADDAIHPAYVETLVTDALRHGADVVSTPKHLLGSERRVAFLQADISDEPPSVFAPMDALTALYNGRLERGNNGCQLLRVDTLKQHNLLFDTTMAIGEDFDFLARTIIISTHVVVDNRALYYYRANPGSAVHQAFNIRHYEAIKNMQAAGRALPHPSRQLVEAMDNNLFVASASYGALMYASRAQFRKEFAEIKHTIRRLKWRVVFSKGIKYSGRIRALLIICFGVNLGLIIIRKLIKI